ncbi:LOW QUALITY PROTEIN: ubiquitin conjugation factor E4 A-like [Haliotis rubra]|uniref:LOW QUALITY PROTEIN: ubiquitin conjugation factor E4 A-like n=1 Tax=Haliotis rubra TaxID=36100 RepID=UPI001EE59646|nr:LOW QUALITY PROTEIN: ubiquitin conjugation factor E4 A-like [Haliotis rubra]
MGDNSIADNPFAALFPTLTQAQQYSSTITGSKTPVSEVSCLDNTTKEAAPTNMVQDENDMETKALEAVEFNEAVEKIFLITLDNGTSSDVQRPSRCVYLEEMASALQGQTWFDQESLPQAVFERVMMENPSGSMITSRTSGKDAKAAAAACETEVLRYMFQCYTRLQASTEELKTELFPTQMVHLQFLDIFQEEFDFLSGGLRTVPEGFFLHLSREIDINKEEGTLLEVFKPVLEAFMTYNAPWDWKNGKAFEMTLIGAALSLSCIPKNETGPYEFFNNPSSAPKQEHDITEANIWQPLSNLCEHVHQMFLSLIKLSPDLRHTVLTWLGKCLQANSGRTKIWSNQIPQLFNQMYCSEGFSLNLCHVMLKLCQPFSNPTSAKLLKIQPSYTSAVAASDEEVKSRCIHAGGLNTETKLVQVEDESAQPSPPSDTSYNFITECFFLTQQVLNLGFHMVHDKFLKLNQDLHRVQRVYNDMRGQAPDEEQEPMRSVKAQMEKGMTLYLSMKAALTEPRLMEMSLNFHIAAAAWLVQVAVHDDISKCQTVTFPLPEEAPAALAYIPEFLMGNLTDFVLFCQRFKSDMFQLAGEQVNHLMTLILVFMGSPERMKNPHLRAELADTLAALMPDKDSGRSGILSSFHRDQLFVKHPQVSHLSTMLLHVFVSIEMTGQSVEFEQKFNYRRPMYQVLEYIWEIDIHKQAIKELSVIAEAHIEDTDPPLFLRFVNLLINDAIFLLDEALQYMSQIKEKQQEKERGDWNNLEPRQRQETENNFRHLGMLARYHNVMANYTIHALELLTREIQTIFCHNMLVDRIAGMLNYFLLHLVGPKQRNFNVKDKNEYEFKPQQIVQDITKIYLNLGESDMFCRAVSGDERSYSPELFAKAVQVLQKISTMPQVMSDFLGLEDKIRGYNCICDVVAPHIYVMFAVLGRQYSQEEEELLADVPEEFLDPIMGTLMKDPVLLPSSKNIVDKATIARHILRSLNQSDPLNRSPLSLEKVEPLPELKAKIHAWIAETKSKAGQS